MKENKVRIKEKRKYVYIEFIRILAIFGVIYSHMEQYVVNREDLIYGNKLLYILLNGAYTVSKTAVPLFFMISGCLLLNKEEGIKEIIKRRVLRMLFVLVLFSFLFYLTTINYDVLRFSLLGFMKYIYGKGVGTYWYLYAYICFLLSLPFTRAVAKAGKNNPNLFLYLLLLENIFSLVIPMLNIFSGVQIHYAVRIAFLSESIFYSLMGYYFGQIRNSSKKEYVGWLFSATFIGLLEGILNIICTYVRGEKCFEFSTWGIFVICIAIFVGCKQFFDKHTINATVNKFIYYVGSMVFSIYLMECILGGKMMVIYNILSDYIPKCISFIVYLNATVLVGALIGTIIKKMPILNKLL